jgi:anaerobic dimethyl sulfoxide reductase subunit A
MAGLLEKIESSSIDRRKFVGLAATAGVVASLGLTGCDNKVVETDKPIVDLDGGEWVPFNCISGGCGFRCYNQAYVVDGVIIRQETDNSHPDSDALPQMRGCLKGRSARKGVTGVDRLKYPMKRKNWQPGGGNNINGELRGIDEWERVTWDEALQIISDELIRIRDTYGNRAILSLGMSEPKVFGFPVGSPLLNALGGCLTTFGEASGGLSPMPKSRMMGTSDFGAAQDRMSIRHSKLIVLWGQNPAWNSGGTVVHWFVEAKKQSEAKIIVVDPWFNPTAWAIADQWVPVRPGTDGALLEAIAYEIIVNNWQDQDFLDRCTVGFDADHMPSGAKINENFKDYILGEYDGQPKTPEWASTICGTPVNAIKDLAQQMGTIKPMALKACCAPSRTYYGNRWTQLYLTVGWMTGNVGKLGSEVSMSVGTGNTYFGGTYLMYGSSGFQMPPNPICTEPRTGFSLDNGGYDPNQEFGIAFTEMWKAIAEGEYTLPGPAKNKRQCDIKCLYRDNLNQTATQYTGGKWFEEAIRKVEFVCVTDLFLSVDAQYADIVLPAKSSFECELSTDPYGNPPDHIICGRKVIEPYFESKADAEIVYELADKLEISAEVIPRMSVKQAEFNRLAGATLALPADGVTRSPLLTITDKDLENLGVEGSPQEGVISIGEFLERGSYQVERQDSDSYMNVFNKTFVEDPAGHPVGTPSGKYEICCQSLKDYYDLACFHDIDAIPKYKAAVDGYEQSTSDPTYPFQLLGVHIYRQAHSMYNNIKQINEVAANDLLMNTADAEMLGYKRGDWVLVTSSQSSFVRRLNIVPYVMPGVLVIGQGNWRRINQDNKIDEGGNINGITPSHLVATGGQGYNTLLVKIEQYSGTQLKPDYRNNPIVPLKD